jgi:hypothetical protein
VELGLLGGLQAGFEGFAKTQNHFNFSTIPSALYEGRELLILNLIIQNNYI